jgi:cytoskeletal protein CcmA (bactofilin family)
VAPLAPPAIIAAGVRVTGNIQSDGDVHVDGRVDGDIEARSLTIGEHGHVVGHIDVDDVFVQGIVNGAIRAGRVRLTRTSRVIADITHDVLVIDEGASFEGHCRRVPVDPADEVGAAPPLALRTA